MHITQNETTKLVLNVRGYCFNTRDKSVGDVVDRQQSPGQNHGYSQVTNTSNQCYTLLVLMRSPKISSISVH